MYTLWHHLIMNNANTKTVRKMSDAVIACELRALMAEIDCQCRHGLQPTKAMSDYGVALLAEQARR